MANPDGSLWEFGGGSSVDTIHNSDTRGHFAERNDGLSSVWPLLELVPD
jgi:hypothetical protein